MSGRSAVWPRFQQLLEQQTWPHLQVKLWLLDTSQDERCGRLIRRWINQCMRLAIVSGNADGLATHILGESFVRASDGSGVTWYVAAKVQCPDKSDPKRCHWRRLQDELSSSDWDLLLCSAGSLSPILCEHARQVGRSVIDIGALGLIILQKDVVEPLSDRIL